MFSSKELQIIEAFRNEKPMKINMVKLNRFLNRETGLTYMYCLCSLSELESFKIKFYKWFDEK